MGRVSSGTLIGRETELETLTKAMGAAADGRSSAVVVSGEAGIGKTRLLQEVKRWARGNGAEAVIGGCIPLSEGSLPYAPVIAALRQGVGKLPDPATSLSADSRAELARLLPEFIPLNGDAPTDTNQTRLFGAVLDLIRALSDVSPLVFIVEDLHWSDTSTRDLLTYLLNMTEEERVLFLCSLRTGELDTSHPVPRWVQTLSTSRMVEVVELEPLSREHTQQQMREITGSQIEDAVAAKIYERSEGNPFFVEELIQASAADNKDLPPSLRDLFLQRITAVPREAVEVVKAASVDGPTVPHELLAATTGMDDVTLTPLLQNAIDRHLLIRAGDDAYAFRHALLREAVYRRLLPGERRSLHRSFAQALERSNGGPSRAAAHSGRLAHHWDEAGAPDRALPHALAAAKDAEDSYASSEAFAHYQHALQLWDKVEDPETVAGVTKVSLLESAAATADSAARPEESLALWKEAIELVDPSVHPARAARLRSLAAYVLGCELMNDSEALLLLQDAQRLVRDLPPSVEKAEVVSRASSNLTLTGHMDEGLEAAKMAMEIVQQIDDPIREAQALGALALAYQLKGDLDLALTHHSIAVEICRRELDGASLGINLTNLSDAMFRANRAEDAVSCALDAVDELRKLGAQSHLGMLMCNAGEFLVALGRWDEAEQIIASLEQAPVVLDRAFSTSLLAEIDVGRGRFEQAAARIRAARRLMANVKEPQFLEPVTLTGISLAVWERRYEDASALAQGAWDTPKEERSAARLCALGLMVEAHRAVRARASNSVEVEEQAVRLGTEMQARCPIQTTTSAEVRALQRVVAAETSRLKGSSDAGLWKEAVAAWEEVPYRFQHAYALYRLGEALLSDGERGPARSTLSAANKEAREMGAAPLALEIEGLTRRARLKLLIEEEHGAEAGNGSSPSNELGLTDREVEVLRSLSEGLTNKQIAETLFISPKTASIHVSSILAKLGVSNRLEAARRAFDAGLLDSPRP
ncbi:MAG: helix-turn-helix transcriptional regulator [Actinomycetota bacterium]